MNAEPERCEAEVGDEHSYRRCPGLAIPGKRYCPEHVPKVRPNAKPKPPRCKSEVYCPGGWSRVRCGNIAKYGEYCGVHSPEKQEERRKKRRPTMAALKLAATRRRSEEREFLLKIAEDSRALLVALQTGPYDSQPDEMCGLAATLAAFDSWKEK